MKIKLKTGLLVIVCTLSSTVFADEMASKFCGNEGMKDSFYSIFFNSRTMKHRYTHLYRTVADELGKYTAEACKAGTDFPIISQNSLSICIKTCDTHADEFANGIFGKKQMGQEIFNECASVCNSMNNSHSGYMAGFVDAAKERESNDCINPSKNSLSTLGRAMKKIENESAKPASIKKGALQK